MAPPREPIEWNEETLERIESLRQEGLSWRRIAQAFNVARSVLQTNYERLLIEHRRFGDNAQEDRTFRENTQKNEATVECVTTRPVKTLKDALAVAEVDTSVWYVHEWTCRQWTTPMNVKKGQEKATLKKKRYRAGDVVDCEEEELRWAASVPVQQQQYLVAMKLRRKTPATRSLETLLDEIAHGSLVLPAIAYVSSRKAHHALEISVMDPHLGLRCFQPQADHAWNLDEAESAYMATVEKLLRQAEVYAPFKQIVMAFGNDYLHADNVSHTTTAGTHQPEMDSIHETFIRSEKLALWKTERLRQLAPLKVYSIPGNHDRFAAFTLARLIKAFYAGAKVKTVDVDASPTPYKFWNYGCTLIGFDHGHSINPTRLIGLMANETRLNYWQKARYCEWHLGDQHRKGSSRPFLMEEQGASFEYLPSLTPANEWHKIKGFNWQKRGGVAFIYEEEAGPLAKLQVNFDSYSGKIMGQ